MLTMDRSGSASSVLAGKGTFVEGAPVCSSAPGLEEGPLQKAENSTAKLATAIDGTRSPACPDVPNPDGLTADVRSLDVASPEVADRDSAGPDVANADVANADVANLRVPAPSRRGARRRLSAVLATLVLLLAGVAYRVSVWRARTADQRGSQITDNLGLVVIGIVLILAIGGAITGIDKTLFNWVTSQLGINGSGPNLNTGAN